MIRASLKNPYAVVSISLVIVTLGVVSAAAIGLSGCAATTTSRLGDYLVGMPVPSAQPQQLVVAIPIRAGLVLAMPEAELGRPTAPSQTLREQLTDRIKKGLQDTQRVDIKQVVSPLTLPGEGLAALSLSRLRELVKDQQIQRLFVVVATSKSAQRVLPYPLFEAQLFARMDLALVDLTTGQVLLTEVGQEDYDMMDRYDGVKDILYPRIFYRTITNWAGPFKLVDGDPYVALGEETFSGATDQLIMRLRERLTPS